MGDSKSNEILFSQKKCLGIGLTKSIAAPLIFLKEEELRITLKNNKRLINAFRKCVNRAYNQFKKKKYIFLLVDIEGYLLDIIYDKRVYKNIDNLGIRKVLLLKKKAVVQMPFHWQ